MSTISTLEGFALGLPLIYVNQKIFEAIKKEPLLIYYYSGETNYVSWKVILTNGQRKVEFDKWLISAPWSDLRAAINRVAIAAGDEPKLDFGSLRVYIKYPYSSHNCQKIQLFVQYQKKDVPPPGFENADTDTNNSDTDNDLYGTP